MATQSPTMPPHDAVLQLYRGTAYQFSYPAAGKLAHFSHDGGVTVLAVLVPDDRYTLDFRIAHEPEDTTPAEQAARNFYAGAVAIYDESDNVPPFSLTLAGSRGWRARKRFVDGLNALLVLDQAFLQTGNGLYTFSYTVSPEVYAHGQWIFDLMLNTFTLLT